MVKVTNMNDILHIEAPKIDMTQPHSNLSATEMIEKEIEEDIQLHRAYDLFEKLLGLREYARAKKVAWHLYQNGLTVNGLFEI